MVQMTCDATWLCNENLAMLIRCAEPYPEHERARVTPLLYSFTYD